MSELENLIQSELPGVKFRVEQWDDLMTVLEWVRVKDGYRVAVDPRMPQEGLSISAQRAIDDLRERAIADYGLGPVIEREKQEAHRQGVKEMSEAVRHYVRENMTRWVQVYGEEGWPTVEWVKDGLTREGQLLMEWLETGRRGPK